MIRYMNLSELQSDAEGVNLFAIGTAAECRQEVVCQSDGHVGKWAATDRKGCAELPWVHHVGFFATDAPVVIVPHCSGDQFFSAIAQHVNAQINMVGGTFGLGILFTEGVADEQPESKVFGIKVLLGYLSAGWGVEGKGVTIVVYIVEKSSPVALKDKPVFESDAFGDGNGGDYSIVYGETVVFPSVVGRSAFVIHVERYGRGDTYTHRQMIKILKPFAVNVLHGKVASAVCLVKCADAFDVAHDLGVSANQCRTVDL